MAKQVIWGQPANNRLINIRREGLVLGPGNLPPNKRPGAYSINLPLLTDRYAAALATPHATLQRNSAASVTDHEGLVRETLPHEMGFDGAGKRGCMLHGPLLML